MLRLQVLCQKLNLDAIVLINGKYLVDMGFWGLQQGDGGRGTDEDKGTETVADPSDSLILNLSFAKMRQINRIFAQFELLVTYRY